MMLISMVPRFLFGIKGYGMLPELALVQIGLQMKEALRRFGEWPIGLQMQCMRSIQNAIFSLQMATQGRCVKI